MKFWQIAVIAVAIILLGVVVMRWMPAAIVATEYSEWLGVCFSGSLSARG